MEALRGTGKDTSGFSLVQVLLALGLFAPMAMTFSNMMVSQQKVMIKMSERQDFGDVARFADMVVRDATLFGCNLQTQLETRTFTNAPGEPDSLDGVHLPMTSLKSHNIDTQALCQERDSVFVCVRTMMKIFVACR